MKFWYLSHFRATKACGSRANAQICKGYRYTHIQSMGMDEDSGQDFRSLSPLEMSEWALKRGFCAYAISIKVSRAGSFEIEFSKNYKLACAHIKDSDQPAQWRRLIRVFNGRSIGSQGSNISSGGKLRL